MTPRQLLRPLIGVRAKGRVAAGRRWVGHHYPRCVCIIGGGCSEAADEAQNVTNNPPVKTKV